MRTKYLSLCALGALLCLPSCTDDNYDLSDIDTNVSLNVNELVVPINIDKIELDAILDLDDDSQVKKVDDGYAIIESGTFESDPIHVPSFTADEPVIEKISSTLLIHTEDRPAAAARRTRAAGDGDEMMFWYDFSDNSTDVDVNANDVDEAIVKIESIAVQDGTQMKFNIVFDNEGKLKAGVDELMIEHLTISLMNGLNATAELEAGKCVDAGAAPIYDADKGEIVVPTLLTKNHIATLVLDIHGIAGVDNNNSGNGRDFKFDTAKHEFTMSKQCVVKTGEIVVYRKNLSSAIRYDEIAIAKFIDGISMIDFVCTPKMSKITATKFTGRVKYDIDGVDVDPVEIKDLPDFLSQEGTQISLGNPQIYIEVKNPANSEYKLTAQTGMVLTSYVGDTPNTARTLTGGLTFDQPESKFCISPSKPGKYYKGEVEDKDGNMQPVDFTVPDETQYKPFADLGKILMSTGGNRKILPDSIAIDIQNPHLPEQDVADFELDSDIDKVEGKYVFYAPLSLGSDSRIHYTDTINGWNDEDVDAILISRLKVNFEMSTDIPLSAKLTIRPIDANGKPIGGVVGTALAEYTAGNIAKPIEVVMNGDIRHLDGITITAEVTPKPTSGSTALLEPSQKLHLSNIRATVSGKYEKEL